jgi:aminoglycoside/choline kinase family phosphotransferase
MPDATEPGFVDEPRLDVPIAPVSCIPPRKRAMAAFLDACGWGGFVPMPLAGDASFRSYYRLQADRRRAVLMDAPPPQEDVTPYVSVSALLRDLGFSAPEVFAEDRTRGFLLIEDFGDDTYTRLLDSGADEATLYTLAVDTLVALQHAVATRDAPELPPYDVGRLLAEAALLVDWYAPAVLGSPLPDALREEYLAIWRVVLPQAALSRETLVLRDYHVDNLMLLPDRAGVRGCGLLDFQDAVRGPASYDLASLLEDARRDVPAELRRALTERYLAAFPALDRAAFLRSTFILAAQRNCKILGIFTRLWKRDGKPGYLVHIPRVWRLLEQDLAHPALAPIALWLDRYLPRGARRISNPPGTA